MESISYPVLFLCTLCAVCATDNLIMENKFRKITQNDVGLRVVREDFFLARSVLECSVQSLQSLYTAFIYDKSSLMCRPGVGTDPLGTKPLPGQSMYVADWLDSSQSTQPVTTTKPMDTTWALGETSTTVVQPFMADTTDHSDSTIALKDFTSPIPTETATTQTTTKFPCDVSLGYRIITYNTSNACLYLSTSDFQYFAAVTNCSGISGRLATMKSLEKRDTILRFLQDASTKSKFWLGLKAIGGLVWSDGKNLTQEEKSLGFYASSSCGLTTCGCYAYDKIQNTLNDNICIRLYPFICEYLT